MADNKQQFLDAEGLKRYDTKIKEYSDDADAEVLSSAKKYADEIVSNVSIEWGRLGAN